MVDPRQVPETTYGHRGRVHLHERGSKTSQSGDPRKARRFVRLNADFPMLVHKCDNCKKEIKRRDEEVSPASAGLNIRSANDADGQL